jgi:hypothetical protein
VAVVSTKINAELQKARRRDLRDVTKKSDPNASNNTASCPGRLAWVFVRRRNSSLMRSSAFVVRSAFLSSAIIFDAAAHAASSKRYS